LLVITKESNEFGGIKHYYYPAPPTQRPAYTSHYINWFAVVESLAKLTQRERLVQKWQRQ